MSSKQPRKTSDLVKRTKPAKATPKVKTTDKVKAAKVKPKKPTPKPVQDTGYLGMRGILGSRQVKQQKAVERLIFQLRSYGPAAWKGECRVVGEYRQGRDAAGKVVESWRVSAVEFDADGKIGSDVSFAENNPTCGALLFACERFLRWSDEKPRTDRKTGLVVEDKAALALGLVRQACRDAKAAAPPPPAFPTYVADATTPATAQDQVLVNDATTVTVPEGDWERTEGVVEVTVPAPEGEPELGLKPPAPEPVPEPTPEPAQEVPTDAPTTEAVAGGGDEPAVGAGGGDA